MSRQVILSYAEYVYDDYQSVVGTTQGIDMFYWDTFELGIKHLSTNRTMEGDYVLVF